MGQLLKRLLLSLLVACCCLSDGALAQSDAVDRITDPSPAASSQTSSEEVSGYASFSPRSSGCGGSRRYGHVSQSLRSVRSTDEEQGKRERRAVFNKYRRQPVGNLRISVPYRWVGMVGDTCTGTLVGPRHVLTAGHCVHGGGPGEDYKALENIDFRPAMDSSQAPVDTPYWFGSTAVVTTNEWMQYGDNNDLGLANDYAIITLETDTGLGWMNMAATPAPAAGETVNMVAYHDDKPEVMMMSTGPLLAVTAETLQYQLDTIVVSSGAAVYRITNGRRATALGVHNVEKPGLYNQAVRLTAKKLAQICAWINDSRVESCRPS